MFYQTIYPTYTRCLWRLVSPASSTLILMPLFIKLMKKEMGQQVR